MLLGAFILQVASPQKTVTRWMFDGALTQLVTGVAMVGLLSAGAMEGESANNAVVGIKTVVVIIVAILAFIGRRRPAPQTALWAIIGVLTLVNVCVAVFAGIVVS
jgi:hypothetical protein